MQNKQIGQVSQFEVWKLSYLLVVSCLKVEHVDAVALNVVAGSCYTGISRSGFLSMIVSLCWLANWMKTCKKSVFQIKIIGFRSERQNERAENVQRERRISKMGAINGIFSAIFTILT